MGSVLRRIPSTLLVGIGVVAAFGVGVAAGAGPSRLAEATAQTTAAGTAQFTLTISGTIGGTVIKTYERGSVSFKSHTAHVYKLVPNSPYPEEQIVIGPLTYSNANVQQALSDPRAKPWTKLDTRRLPAGRRLAELDHVRALVYLAAGTVATRQIGPAGTLTHFSGRVEPKRVLAGAPAAQRATLAAVLRVDYTPVAFRAEFWLDGKSRVRRVRVAYRTKGGTTITLDGGFSAFGVAQNLKLPPAREIADITPRK